jgi:predicted DNA-binding transcriptional regulator AlpA
MMQQAMRIPGAVHRVPAAVEPEELITSAQAAARLGLKEQTLTAWRCDNRGPAFIKIGRAVWYRQADIAAFIAACRCEPGGPKESVA